MYPLTQPHPTELERVFQLVIAAHDATPIPLPSSTDIPAPVSGVWLRGKLVSKVTRT